MRVRLEDVDKLEREINGLLSNVKLRVCPVRTVGRVYVCIEVVKRDKDDVLFRCVDLKQAYKFLVSVYSILSGERCLG